LKCIYPGQTPQFPENIFYKIKKNWGGPIFEGRAGMIIYQLSRIGLGERFEYGVYSVMK
jgi:hypothetical protein